MKDHTIIKCLTIDENYKTISDKTHKVYYRNYSKFENLPKICQSEDVRKEFNEFLIANGYDV